MARPYAYASLPDVANHLTFFKSAGQTQATFTATSQPNATQVSQFLHDISDELDSRLAQHDYTVPIATGATSAFDLLNNWTSIGAAMHAAAAMPQGSSSKHLEFLERRWNAILTALDKGETVIARAAKQTTLSKVRFPAAPASGVGASPYFTREFEGGR